MNLYLEEQLVKERMDEARATAARQALILSVRPARRRVRVAVGHALIRVGHWVAGRAPGRTQPSRMTA